MAGWKVVDILVFFILESVEDQSLDTSGTKTLGRVSVMLKNTSLAAPGALAHHLQRRTACNTAEANLHSPNQKTYLAKVNRNAHIEK